MLHCSQDASTGWTRNSLGESMAKRGCLSVVHGCGRERNRSGGCDGRNLPSAPRVLQDRPVRVDVATARSYAGPWQSRCARGSTTRGDAGSVTVSEFMFLAIGLVLGLASGAALIEILRARPPARREVRLTVAHDAIPRRRPTTLADDAFVAVGPEPARGGPADRRGEDGPAPVRSPERRTNVLRGRMVRASGARGGRTPRRGPAPRPRAGARWACRSRPAPIRCSGALRGRADGRRPRRRPLTGRPRVRRHGGDRAPNQRANPAGSSTAAGLLDDPAGLADRPTGPAPTADARHRRRAPTSAGWPTSGASWRPGPRPSPRIGGRRAATGAARLRQPHLRRRSRQPARRIRARSGRSRRTAQRAFRAASKAAGSRRTRSRPAARTWLQEINRINREAAASVLAARSRARAAAAIGATLERLSLAAEAARVGAEMADAACLAARSAVADCDERQRPRATGSPDRPAAAQPNRA